MKIKAARKHEAGQVLPILALALVALLGFAALALDGGNLYTEQRRAQAAADNAVMAAAFLQMSGPYTTTVAQLAEAAYKNAERNGYKSTDPGATRGTTMAFHSPPAHGAYAGNIEYMEVVITQTVPTSLAHLVYRQNPIPLTVIAIAHGLPSGPIMPGYALAAMKAECDGPSTIYIQGRGGGNNGGAFLTDGGAFVNADCPDALTASGNHDGIVTDGPPAEISIAGDTYEPETGLCATQAEAWDVTVHCNYYPAPITGVPQVDQDPMASTPAGIAPSDDACGPDRHLPTELNDPVGIQPGSYTTLDSGGRDIIMRPGIYCLTGGKLETTSIISGTGVLIYMVDEPTRINCSGNCGVNLYAPTTATTGCTGVTDTTFEICKYLGILVYKLTGNNICSESVQDIDFTGNSTMTVVGLIYAPYSLVRFGGGGSLTMRGQTIAGCVKFNGDGRIDIIYDPSVSYSPPPSVRLDQ